MQILPGSPFPLGATWDSEGVNFALFSENATAVELCLFDAEDRETRIPVSQRTSFVWHVYVAGVSAGQRYGYRVHGPYEPEKGLRFNPNVVLLDPYARAVDGVERWEAGCFAYRVGGPQGDLAMETADQLGAPRGVVVDTSYDWEGDAPLRTPWHRTVIYEAHVKGLTMLHPDVPPALRGTYSAIAHPSVIHHMRDLGVTAIELMPVHAFVDDKLLKDRGLRNYWGYSTIGYFAPDVRYRSAGAIASEVREFKDMVKALHRAGIEVILDVVYNHTAEGNHLGPTMSLKGIDNPTYYRLVPDQPRYYFDYTGTGNTLDVRHPQALALVMDSLRYWASEMHVDGFRFDLASALARQLHEVDQLASFFTLIHQSPVLSQLKLIAEPWDVGEGGYQVGNFPVRWAEWNGRYRDAVRALWRGEGGKAGEIGYRLTGSSDLYQSNGRRPSASINLVTAHDGLTLNDLVTYERKHNEANGEGNRDGHDDERAFNCGHEGPTADEAVNALRRRQRRNLMATLLLSQGTPMIVAGDEFGRTQRGNNNAYCQDNELSWLSWEWSSEERALFEVVKKLLRIRRAHPALHRSQFFQGRKIHGTDLRDISWFCPDGRSMSEDDWQNPSTRAFSMFLAGRGIDDIDSWTGRPIVDDNLLLLLNASDHDVELVVPHDEAVREPWQLLVDTADDGAEETRPPGERTLLVARSLKFFRSPSRVVRNGGSLHTLGATYRVQLHAGFGFDALRDVLDYLANLGVTDVYTSPIFAACKGSTHGYDVVDHSRINPELGGEEAFERLSDALASRGMGLVLDWVPNHMGIAGSDNVWFQDVLENGPSSRYAEFFDIDWRPAKEGLRDKVLLPILGAAYGEVLEKGDITVVMERGFFALACYERRLPLAPETLVPFLDRLLGVLGLPEGDPDAEELQSIVYSLRRLPPRSSSDAAARRERYKEIAVAKRRFSRLYEQRGAVQEAVTKTLGELNGERGRPESFAALDALVRAQSYRIADWRVAAEEINYRRFFDINDLAAIRMECPDVFALAHEKLFSLIAKGRVKGLRLDHTDGLYEPAAYFESLQQRFRLPRGPGASDLSPDDLARPLPIFVEKILEPGEELPASWPVDGTTGYEFAHAATGILVDARNETLLTKLYQSFTGDRLAFADHVYRSKRHILRSSLASEVHMLSRSLERIAAKTRLSQDFTLGSLTRAVVEVLSAFSIYRTYIHEDGTKSEADERYVEQAVAAARRRTEAWVPNAIFDFLREVLLLHPVADPEERSERSRFCLRFQQLTGPVMAKAIEDTAFYRYNRLVCANEVGGTPARIGFSSEQLHRQNETRARGFPLSMTTTSTHDTKRGEDASARIAVLSEMPSEWARTVRRWSELAAKIRAQLPRQDAPSKSLEYLIYQSIVGAWPAGWDGAEGRTELVERIAAFAYKAAKEAKTETSWLLPDEGYESCTQELLNRLFGSDDFVHDVAGFIRRIAPSGVSNSLALVLLRMCSPGIPDTYQGAELYHNALVDPDNRRPVDYAARAKILADIQARWDDRAALASEACARFEDGGIKMLVLHAALLARRAHPMLFLRGDYQPLPGNDHVFAFARMHGTERALCFVTRFPFQKTRGERPFATGDVWGNERLFVPHSGEYEDLVTGARVVIRREARLSDVFARAPVALLFGHTKESIR